MGSCGLPAVTFTRMSNTLSNLPRSYGGGTRRATRHTTKEQFPMSDDNTTETATVTGEAQVDESAETQAEDGVADLGDAGKKALDAMKAERNAARADARAKATELEQLRSAAALKDKPAEEQALEAAKAEARSEATVKANERILRADLRAAATGKLADPTDAALYINLSEFTVTDDGDTDSDALNDAIDDLLTRKPHLGAAPLKRFEGSGDQGANRVTKPSQFTDADLANMSPAEINKARRDGRLETVLGKTT